MTKSKQAPIDVPEGVKLTEGSVVPLRDFDGTTVWLRITGTFDSKAMGPALTGHQYATQEAAENTIDKHYMGTRSLPLSALIDIEGEKIAKKAHVTAVRQRRTGGGICEHCGERTGGGRFLPGHDAKLKSMLSADDSDEAVAEQIIRGWGKDLLPTAAQKKLVKQGDGFMRSRIANRTGTDPGGADR